MIYTELSEMRHFKSYIRNPFNINDFVFFNTFIVYYYVTRKGLKPYLNGGIDIDGNEVINDPNHHMLPF